MAMIVRGKIKYLGPDIDVSNSFMKRELVVTTDEQYPQHIMIEFTQDKCRLLDHYRVGMAVTVDINLRGREWVNPQGETKYFNQITGWRISQQEGTSAQAQTTPAPPPAPASNFTEEDHDDLPF